MHAMHVGMGVPCACMRARVCSPCTCEGDALPSVSHAAPVFSSLCAHLAALLMASTLAWTAYHGVPLNGALQDSSHHSLVGGGSAG